MGRGDASAERAAPADPPRCQEGRGRDHTPVPALTPPPPKAPGPRSFPLTGALAKSRIRAPHQNRVEPGNVSSSVTSLPGHRSFLVRLHEKAARPRCLFHFRAITV